MKKNHFLNIPHDAFGVIMSFIPRDTPLLREVCSDIYTNVTTLNSHDMSEYSRYLFLNLYLNTLHHLTKGTDPSLYIKTIITQWNEFVVQNNIERPLATLDKLFTIHPSFVDQDKYINMIIKSTNHLTQIKYKISDLIHYVTGAAPIDIMRTYNIPDYFNTDHNNTSDMITIMCDRTVELTANKELSCDDLQKALSAIGQQMPTTYLVQLIRHVPKIGKHIINTYFATLKPEELLQIAHIDAALALDILRHEQQKGYNIHFLSTIGQINSSIMELIINNYYLPILNNKIHSMTGDNLILMLLDYFEYYINVTKSKTQENSSTIDTNFINKILQHTDKYNKEHIKNILKHDFCTKHHGIIIPDIIRHLGDKIIEFDLIDDLPSIVKAKYTVELMTLCTNHLNDNPQYPTTNFRSLSLSTVTKEYFEKLQHQYKNDMTYKHFMFFYHHHSHLDNYASYVQLIRNKKDYSHYSRKNVKDIIDTFISYQHDLNNQQRRNTKEKNILIKIVQHNSDKVMEVYTKYKDHLSDKELIKLFQNNMLCFTEQSETSDTPIIHSLSQEQQILLLQAMIQHNPDNMQRIWEQCQDLITNNIQEFIQPIFNSQHNLKDTIFDATSQQIKKLYDNEYYLNTNNIPPYVASKFFTLCKKHNEILHQLLASESCTKDSLNTTLQYFDLVVKGNNHEMIRQIVNVISNTKDVILKEKIIHQCLMISCNNKNAFAIDTVLSFMSQQSTTIINDNDEIPNQTLIQSLTYPIINDCIQYNNSTIKYFLSLFKDITHYTHEAQEQIICYYISDASIQFEFHPDTVDFLVGTTVED